MSLLSGPEQQDFRQNSANLALSSGIIARQNLPSDMHTSIASSVIAGHLRIGQDEHQDGRRNLVADERLLHVPERPRAPTEPLR